MQSQQQQQQRLDEHSADYWEGGVYGRPSQTGSYGAQSSAASSYASGHNKQEARTWAEFLGLASP